MDEAHVEHAVGFVEDQGLHVAEVDGALAGQVEQAAGAGDQQVETLGQGLHLRVHADAAEDAGADQRQVAGVDLEAVVDLRGQFAGRGQDQHAGLSRPALLGLVRVTVGEQPLEDGQGEACGFTSTRLGGDHQVAALQHGGNGPLLHRSGFGVASRRYGGGQSLGETEGGKGHESSCLVRARPGIEAWLEARSGTVRDARRSRLVRRS
ncbi:hypothetical protein D9M68_684460 [compost metagenome]